MNWTFAGWWFEPIARILAAVIVILLGAIAAGKLASLLRKFAKKQLLQPAITESPLSMVWEGTKPFHGTGLVSGLIFWSVFSIFIALAGEALGITLFSQFLRWLGGYIPHLLSAVIVLLIGIFLASVVERAIKPLARNLADGSANMVAAGASSVVLVLATLMALAELGVASTFILILFAGLVFMVSLAVGLAIGLGSKDQVAQWLQGLNLPGAATKRRSK